MDKWEKKVLFKILIIFNILVISLSIAINWSEGKIENAKQFIKIFILGEVFLIIIPMCIIKLFKKKRVQPLDNLHREDILATILYLYVREYL